MCRNLYTEEEMSAMKTLYEMKLKRLNSLLLDKVEQCRNCKKIKVRVVEIGVNASELNFYKERCKSLIKEKQQAKASYTKNKNVLKKALVYYRSKSNALERKVGGAHLDVECAEELAIEESIKNFIRVE